MKKMTKVLAVLTACAFVLAVAAVINAGTKASDVIKMENKLYPKHEKGVVQFSHKKHAVDYKAGCGDCHHDKDGKPLTALKDGDNVQSCAECHAKPGELKGDAAKGKTKKDKMEYHAGALHENCKGCHQEFNKKNNSKAAPTTCSKCHPGGGKDE